MGRRNERAETVLLPARRGKADMAYDYDYAVRTRGDLESRDGVRSQALRSAA
jgi:hypothetical protein